MNKSKKTNKGLAFLGILFLLYLIVLYSNSKGYYEYKEYNKMNLTKEAMERFEEDVKNGKELSANEYIDNIYKDYSNIITKAGVKVGEESKKIMTGGFTKLIKIIGKFLS